MEHLIQLQIERLPEGLCLAASDEVRGLVAQGRTMQAAIGLASDVANKLIEAQAGTDTVSFRPIGEAFDYRLVVAT